MARGIKAGDRRVALACAVSFRDAGVRPFITILAAASCGSKSTPTTHCFDSMKL
jgi:hypothetical protein